MAKANKPKRTTRVRGFRNRSVAGGHLLKFRHIDLQRACISRGLEFDRISDSANSLQRWFIDNFEITPDSNLLDQFDTWRFNLINKTEQKYKGFIRLGYVQERDGETGEITKRKKPRFMKKTKVKKSRNKELGLFSGTKKELTYRLQREGLEVKEVIAKVLESFPDAKDKSIKIWFKRSLKEQTNG